MSLKRFPIVNIMFHVRWIDRIGNETHRVNEFLKSIVLKGWLAAFSSTVEGKTKERTSCTLLLAYCPYLRFNLGYVHNEMPATRVSQLENYSNFSNSIYK